MGSTEQLTEPNAPQQSAPLAVAAVAIACAIVGVGVVVLIARRGDDDLVARAKIAAEQRGSYRFELRQQFEGPGTERLGGAAPFSLDGAVNLDEGTSRLVTTISAPGIKATCTYVSTPNAVYVSVHPSRRATIGASWLRTEPNVLLGSQGFQVRPDQVYNGNSGMFDHLDPDGDAAIGGVRSTKYTGEAKITDLAPSAKDNPAYAGFDETVPVTVFIDDDDLVRRLVFEIRSGRRFGVLMTIDFFDYGEPIDIALPRPNEIESADAQLTTAACFPSRPRR